MKRHIPSYFLSFQTILNCHTHAWNLMHVVCWSLHETCTFQTVYFEKGCAHTLIQYCPCTIQTLTLLDNGVEFCHIQMGFVSACKDVPHPFRAKLKYHQNHTLLETIIFLNRRISLDTSHSHKNRHNVIMMTLQKWSESLRWICNIYN